MKCCKHHNQEGHSISQCQEFRKNVMKMRNKGLLQVETMMGDEVSMIEALVKKYVGYNSAWVGHPNWAYPNHQQHIKRGYGALPHNYEYSFQSTKQSLVFQPKIKGLT